MEFEFSYFNDNSRHIYCFYYQWLHDIDNNYVCILGTVNTCIECTLTIIVIDVLVEKTVWWFISCNENNIMIKMFDDNTMINLFFMHFFLNGGNFENDA